MKTKKVSKNFFVPKNNYEFAAQEIYFLLVENFSETFFVGGIVRDLLLNRKITDIDITTIATPTQVKVLLENNNYKIDVKAIDLGVVKIITKFGFVEVTTFRSEAYTKNRYPKVKFITSLLSDSKRRDFSINALYLQAKSHIIYDPQDGLKDIAAKQIKFIGLPKTKIHQDPLRIIRAYRFSKQLKFSFSPNTKKSLEKYFSLFKTLKTSLIEKEINKSSTLTTKKFLQKKFIIS